MEPRISIVTLGVESITKSRAFYEAMGWKASSTSNDDIVFFQGQGMAFALYGGKALEEDVGIEFKKGFGGVTLAYNGRSKEDVDVVMAEAKQAGAKIMKPAQDVFWGGYSGYFCDPDGHLWEVAWNPFFELSEDGALILPS
jgi:predicted lactoylglutathione lyase